MDGTGSFFKNKKKIKEHFPFFLSFNLRHSYAYVSIETKILYN